MATKRQSKALAKAVVVKISTLSLKPDEVLIIKVDPVEVDLDVMQNLRNSIRKQWPQFAGRIAMLAGNIELSKVKFSDIGVGVQKGQTNELAQNRPQEQS